MSAETYTFNWQMFERSFSVSKFLPIKAGKISDMGRINELILTIMHPIYLRNFSTTGSDNTNLVYNYDIYSASFGNGNNVTTVTLPASPEAIVSQIRSNMVSYVLSSWSTTVAPTDIYFDVPGLGVSSHLFANPSRSLNSAFQISSSRDAMVSYTVDIAATLSLTTGQAGTVTLQYADDSGFTTNVKTVQSSVNGNAGTLAIGLGLTQTASCSLSGVIPAGKYVKLVTTNTTGTPTFTFRAAQEVLL